MLYILLYFNHCMYQIQFAIRVKRELSLVHSLHILERSRKIRDDN